MENINTYLPERPELVDAHRHNMREKFKGRDPAMAICAHMSDEWVANNIYMALRNDLDLVAIQEAARDRIMHLSLRVAELEARTNDKTAALIHAAKHGAAEAERATENLLAAIEELPK